MRSAVPSSGPRTVSLASLAIGQGQRMAGTIANRLGLPGHGVKVALLVLLSALVTNMAARILGHVHTQDYAHILPKAAPLIAAHDHMEVNRAWLGEMIEGPAISSLLDRSARALPAEAMLDRMRYDRRNGLEMQLSSPDRLALLTTLGRDPVLARLRLADSQVNEQGAVLFTLRTQQP